MKGIMAFLHFHLGAFIGKEEAMISMQKKFIFIHVPKTGGNSLQNILRNYSEDEITTTAKHQDGIERFAVRNSRYNTTKHSTLSHYKSVLDASVYNQMFKFATIRNPWDRLISYYFSPHRGVTEWDRDSFLRLVNTLPSIRYFICEKSLVNKFLTKIGIKETVFGKRLDADVDYIMKFESLNKDFSIICKKLDIPASPLPKRNSSVREHYSNYYDDELKEIVRDKFIEEIKFGNYKFKNA